jgi:hypothetical protein
MSAKSRIDLIPSFWLRSSTRPPPLLLPASSISRTASHSPKGPGPKVDDRIQRTNFRAQVPRKRSCSFHGHPACLDPPPSISQGPLGRTTEQSHRVPAQSGGTLGPVFGGPQEFIAVFNELAPTVSRDVIGRTIRVKPGNTLDPINGKLRLRCCLFLLGLLIQLWQLPQPATASSKSGPQRLYTE